MGLFKNLYLDLGFLNPFKKKDNKIETKQDKPKELSPPKPSVKIRELPNISKRLVEKEEIEEIKEKKELPVLRTKVNPPPTIIKPKIEKPEPDGPELPKPEKTSEQQQLSNAPISGSFFEKLYQHLDREDKYLHSELPEKLLKKNLMSEMHGFWKDKKQELQNTVLNKGMKKDLVRKLEELQNLEIEWQKLQLNKERLEDELASKEIFIENNIRALKKTFKKLHFNASPHPEKHFILKNGTTLRNLNELATELRNMDSETFEHHVNENKNDFATWTEQVMGLSELAQNMRSVQSKEELYTEIENWQFTN